MSKIQDFQNKQAELVELKSITEIAISQIDLHNLGEPTAHFMVNGSPYFVGKLVGSIVKNQTHILASIVADMEKEVDAAKAEAIAEAESFLSVEKS